MRVLVCGGRDFTDRNYAFQQLTKLHKERPITIIIEGGQRTRDKNTREIIGGADYWAMRWAKTNSIKLETYKADWEAFGKAAGPMRNQRMLDQGKPDLGVAFKGGNGTADMVSKLKKAGIEVIQF